MNFLFLFKRDLEMLQMDVAEKKCHHDEKKLDFEFKKGKLEKYNNDIREFEVKISFNL
jgi:hypothetical protein